MRKRKYTVGVLDEKEFTCIDCNKEFNLSYMSIRHRMRNNIPFKCRSCLRKDLYNNMTQEQKEIRFNAIKQSWDNYTPEERKNRIKLLQDVWDNKTDIDRKLHGERVLKGKANRTPEQKRISHEKSSNAMKARWRKMSPEEKEDFANIKSNTMRQYWDNLTEEEKLNRKKKKSISMKKYWNNQSEEFRQAKGKQMRDGLNNKRKQK